MGEDEAGLRALGVKALLEGADKAQVVIGQALRRVRGGVVEQRI